jgi:hypothetical protein
MCFDAVAFLDLCKLYKNSKKVLAENATIRNKKLADFSKSRLHLKCKKSSFEFETVVKTTLKTQVLKQNPRESESDKNAKRILTTALLKIKSITKAAEEQLNLRLLLSQISFTWNKSGFN